MLRRNEGEKKAVSVDKQTKADSSVLSEASRQIKQNKIKKQQKTEIEGRVAHLTSYQHARGNEHQQTEAPKRLGKRKVSNEKTKLP